MKPCIHKYYQYGPWICEGNGAWGISYSLACAYRGWEVHNQSLEKTNWDEDRMKREHAGRLAGAEWGSDDGELDG